MFKLRFELSMFYQLLYSRFFEKGLDGSGGGKQYNNYCNFEQNNRKITTQAVVHVMTSYSKMVSKYGNSRFFRNEHFSTRRYKLMKKKGKNFVFDFCYGDDNVCNGMRRLIWGRWKENMS